MILQLAKRCVNCGQRFKRMFATRNLKIVRIKNKWF